MLWVAIIIVFVFYIKPNTIENRREINLFLSSQQAAIPTRTCYLQ